MRILVTGASGNFGSRAVRSLLETVPAEDLVVMSRKPDRLEEFTGLGCTAVTGTPIEFVEVGDEEMYAHLDAMGIPRTAEMQFNVDGYAWCSDDMVSYEREVGNGRFAIVSGDVEMLLGRKPKPFRAFVEERAEQLRGAWSR
jgi:hypothetical protein